jgi:hypothetical protein
MEIGYDLDADRARGFTVTETGIVVIGKVDNLAELDERHLTPLHR